MDKIHEIAGGGALMPRFDDGMVNMAELIRMMAESLVNEIMDAQADEASRAATSATATASASSSPASAPSTSGFRSCAPAATSPRTYSALARGPRGHRRGVRDGDQRRVHQEGETRGAAHGHRPHERQPGVEDMLVAGRRSLTCKNATCQTSPTPTSGSTRPTSSAGTQVACSRPRW